MRSLLHALMRIARALYGRSTQGERSCKLEQGSCTSIGFVQGSVQHNACTYTNLLLKLARAFTLRASRPSETLSSYTQMQLYTDAAPVQRPYSARAIRIKACSKDRTKRLPRCARALRCLENQTCCARTRTLLKLARAFSPCVPHVGLRRSGAAIHVYTAAAPTLSASRRVTKTARRGVLDVHAGIVLYRTLNKTYARTRTLLKLLRERSPCALHVGL